MYSPPSSHHRVNSPCLLSLPARDPSHLPVRLQSYFLSSPMISVIRLVEQTPLPRSLPPRLHSLALVLPRFHKALHAHIPQGQKSTFSLSRTLSAQLPATGQVHRYTVAFAFISLVGTTFARTRGLETMDLGVLAMDGEWEFLWCVVDALMKM